MKRPVPIDLRRLILLFVLLSVISTLGNALYIAYSVQRAALVRMTLESNEAYAAKVASSIDEFLRSADSHLAYSAGVLASGWSDSVVLAQEAERLREQDSDFTSVTIVDAAGARVQEYPEGVDKADAGPFTGVIQRALIMRHPWISEAYLSVSGDLAVFISHPVIGSDGAFLGLVGGSVSLNRRSPLNVAISSHFHRDGTYAFVTDSQRRVLYHPEQARVGMILRQSASVDSALRGESGSMALTNDRGVAMLAGYAHVPDVNWAIVAQQPQALSLETLQRLMQNMLFGLIPACVLGLGLIWVGATLISRPLRQLSGAADQMAAPDSIERLRQINAWYRDAAAIQQAMIVGGQSIHHQLGRLSHEAQSDAMTGLANRRAMDAALLQLEQTGQEYSLLALDIDHFKRVNDTFGHDVGDVTIIKVAEILKQNSRENDLACRAGGEEFTLILPKTPLAVAADIAERIRDSVATADFPHVGRLTISAGVACRFPDKPAPADAILKLADEQLYHAKQNGRNRVSVAVG